MTDPYAITEHGAFLEKVVQSMRVRAFVDPCVTPIGGGSDPMMLQSLGRQSGL